MNEQAFWKSWCADPFTIAARLWARYTTEHPAAVVGPRSKARVGKSRPYPKRPPRAIGAPARGKRKIASSPNPWPKGRKLRSKGFRK